MTSNTAAVVHDLPAEEEIEALLRIGLRNRWHPLCPAAFVTAQVTATTSGDGASGPGRLESINVPTMASGTG